MHCIARPPVGMLRRRALAGSVVNPLARLLSTNMQSWLAGGLVAAPKAARGRRDSPAGVGMAGVGMAAFHHRAARYSRVPLPQGPERGGAGLGCSDGADAELRQLERAAAAPRMAIASSHREGAASTSYRVYAAEDLHSTWLSHWRQHEERLRFRRAVLRATRGRQLHRRRALSALVAPAPAAGLGQEAGSSEQEDALILAAALAAAEAAVGAGDGAGTSSRLTWLRGGATSRPRANSSTRANGSAAQCTVGASGSAGYAAGRRIEPGRGRMSDLEWLYGLPDEEEAELEALDWPPPGGEQAGGEGAGEGALGPQRLRLNGGRGVTTIRPLWISVHQREGSREARLYESVVPLEDAVLRHLATPLAPFAATTGLRFGPGDVADTAGGGGGWRNFFVGVVGGVGAVEEEVLWPNQVLHRDRLLYNARDALDLARFLALPEKADIEQHLAHLRRLAAERGHRRGWCWHMLRQRWGGDALREHGVQV